MRRRGISLLEVLISMFVLLFGLMGVAAVFPVGNHYAGQGEIYDRAAVVADQAFADIQARGLLSAWHWLYPQLYPSPDLQIDDSYYVIQQPGAIDIGGFNAITSVGYGPGHAFVIDPAGVAAANHASPPLDDPDVFPYGQLVNPWAHRTAPLWSLSHDRWPIRRVTVPATSAAPDMTPQVASAIVQLRDDVVNSLPDEGDRPGRLQWDASRGADIKDPTDDIPLARSYSGGYSWLATVVPTGSPIANAPAYFPNQVLQPKHEEYLSRQCEVSVAIIHKREVLPSTESERCLTAEFTGDRELVVYDVDPQFVDEFFKDVRPVHWLAVTGVTPNGRLLLRWYKIQSLDDETIEYTLSNGPIPGRLLNLDGPEWPANTYSDLRAIIIPGTVAVTTRSLSLE